MTVDKEKLDEALSKGEMPELPPNIPPGFMGEIAPDLRKADDFKPSLNAGIIQEATWETQWLTIVLLYVLVITSPVALWVLWREPRRTLRSKVVATVIGVALYAAVWLFTKH